MTADEIARELKISRCWLFELKRRFPTQAPADFSDLAAWRVFLDRTRLQAKVRGRKSAKTPGELSDYGRLVKGRADKLELERQMLAIQLAATERRLIGQEEVVVLFSTLGSVLRARFSKLINDLPEALAGRAAADIDSVLRQRVDVLMADFVLPSDFFSPRGTMSRSGITSPNGRT